MITLSDITKIYEMGDERVEALAGLSLHVEAGEYARATDASLVVERVA